MEMERYGDGEIWRWRVALYPNAFFFLCQVFVTTTRRKNREKEPQEEGEVESPKSEDLSPEELVRIQAEKRRKDLFIAFILRMNKTVYIKVGLKWFRPSTLRVG